ncbi:MAG: CDP-diacylglycerol--glycerol-3-phosphate 3-phosphatidyltransferase [Bdellovibrionales bacterium]|nr:CDP-diacylglycerol--glycerol-3-phosphate 3-phosphatidyltransferase [Bdellovibrionales bacterium]
MYWTIALELKYDVCVASQDPSNSSEFSLTTTPNLLTMARMLLVPVVVILLYQRTPSADLAAALVFAVASITDYFDGYLARVQKSVSVYGKLMDPLADKFLVVSSLIMLQEIGRLHATVVMILVCRELAITGLRALASAEGVIMSASPSAKWKTATQMVAIPLMMAKDPLFGIPIYPIGKILLAISITLSIGSAVSYVVEFFKKLRIIRALGSKLKRTKGSAAEEQE